VPISASALLGTVQVTDDRAGLAGWTATVSSTDFTTGGGTAAETIPAHDILYSISGFASTTGSATLTRTPGTNLSTALQAVAQATNVNGDNSAAWSPLIQVAVPSGAVAGTYSAIITHSVS
jgi:WxL domain surface cell wall-binding